MITEIDLDSAIADLSYASSVTCVADVADVDAVGRRAVAGRA
jgi:hypothetical protein